MGLSSSSEQKKINKNVSKTSE